MLKHKNTKHQNAIERWSATRSFWFMREHFIDNRSEDFPFHGVTKAEKRVILLADAFQKIICVEKSRCRSLFTSCHLIFPKVCGRNDGFMQNRGEFLEVPCS